VMVTTSFRAVVAITDRDPASARALIVPRALAAPAFEHVDDGARAGGDHRSNQLQSFTAGTAALVRRLAFQDGNLFAEKQIHDCPQITLPEIICQVPGKSNGIILTRITLGRNVAILHRGSGDCHPPRAVAIHGDGLVTRGWAMLQRTTCPMCATRRSQ